MGHNASVTHCCTCDCVLLLHDALTFSAGSRSNSPPSIYRGILSQQAYCFCFCLITRIPTSFCDVLSRLICVNRVFDYFNRIFANN